MDASDIFYFFLLGEGEEVQGGGEVDFLLRIPGGGVFLEGGAKGPGGRLQRIGEFGGVAKYFWSGPKWPRE